ncbi:MAG: COX15/CtaA family protein [Dehalococcoidia bacterium]|jgi:cytochrome c oxidase assembly protein subunit 15|nr:COX15/CtaA family protein [Dehalococcoidia bacterium]
MEIKKTAKRKFFLLFALLGCFFAFFQPTCGAFTRVTDSGDGCPDWPTCFGSWIPPFNDIHAVIEWSHRTSGTLFGLVSIMLVITSYILYKKFNPTVKIYSVALVLIIIVGGIGGLVVLSELDPAIRTVHLAGAQAVAALMVAAFVIETISPQKKIPKNIKVMIYITAVLAISSLLSGAYAVWQGAGAVCYKWPLCSEYIIPKYTNQWIHMTHRLISLALLLYMFRLSIILIRFGISSILGKIGIALLISGILQTVIGASIPLSEFTVWSRSLHLGLATIVWMVSFSIIIVIRNQERS